MTAAVSGDSILVSAGTYLGSVTLKNGVTLIGGYDAAFTSSNPEANPTTLDASQLGPAVFSGPSVGTGTLVQGFILTGGGGDPGAGVIIQGGAPTFRDNEISNNVFAGVAGGVYIFGGSTATLEHNEILDNSTDGSGGGIRVDFSSPSILANSIERNSASHSGGGIHVVGGLPTIVGNTIRGNHAGDGGGGGLHLQAVTSSPIIEGNGFIDNDAIYGGGAMIKDKSIVTFEDNEFTGNIAAVSGGGISAFGHSDITLTSNRFMTCSAESLYGGGLYVVNSNCDVTGDDPISASPDAAFVGCTALNGGGIYAQSSTGVVTKVRTQNCVADSAGGAMFLIRSALTIDQNLIVDCTAFEGGAIAVYSRTSGAPAPDIVRTTIYGSTASGGPLNGGGITVFGNRLELLIKIAASLITHTRVGAAIACREVEPTGQSAQPQVSCSTLHLGPTNPTDPADVVLGSECDLAYISGVFDGPTTNRIGDPLYCPGLDFSLQSCSPDVDTACFPAAENDDRGVHQNDHCACALSLEENSWGQIKARYR
jgi:hypothetical protein